MSMRKLSDFGDLGDEFKGLTLQEFKDKVIETFYETYGRYENVSGKMWVELFHNGDKDDHRKGTVIWRKGIGENEILEDEILEREAAIPRYFQLMNKGYSRVFKGVTQEDMDKHNRLRLERRTKADREGWIGTYYKGKSFFRLNEYKKGEFFIERGYDGAVTETSTESEGGARFELDAVLDKGYRKEGEEECEYTNPLEAFGIEVEDTIEAQEEKAKPKDGELPLDFLTMMSE